MPGKRCAEPHAEGGQREPRGVHRQACHGMAHAHGSRPRCTRSSPSHTHIVLHPLVQLCLLALCKLRPRLRKDLGGLRRAAFLHLAGVRVLGFQARVRDCQGAGMRGWQEGCLRGRVIHQPWGSEELLGSARAVAIEVSSASHDSLCPMRRLEGCLEVPLARSPPAMGSAACGGLGGCSRVIHARCQEAQQDGSDRSHRQGGRAGILLGAPQTGFVQSSSADAPACTQHAPGRRLSGSPRSTASSTGERSQPHRAWAGC